ncbi:MAG: hypothetical protein ACOVSW_21330 [Candidatus Kapaibacteriota bacterium]
MSCDFSFRHYAECAERIGASDRDIEMIHDIDFEPNNVLAMAEIEHRYGISATYFVRLHARTYNPFALPHLPVFQSLTEEYGHKIGLHFEPFFYAPSQIREAITQESSMLGFALGFEVNAISIHEPARFGSISPEDIPIGMKYYCWDAPYYEGKKYISDSGSRWREGCMCGHLHREKLIILTHPDSWYHQTSAENY